MGFLYFMIGLMVGGTVGIFTMCLFQINKRDEKEENCQNMAEKSKINML